MKTLSPVIRFFRELLHVLFFFSKTSIYAPMRQLRQALATRCRCRKTGNALATQVEIEATAEATAKKGDPADTVVFDLCDKCKDVAFPEADGQGRHRHGLRGVAVVP